MCLDWDSATCLLDGGGEHRHEQTMTDRLISSAKRETDAFEATIRPQSLSEFIGQEQARANLNVFIQAAKGRGDALDHVLFAGPPGLGKTTLAQIMAKELGVGFRATSGPVISKAGDLAALLTNLEERDVLFIDEIHRLNRAVEEILYSAMEDYAVDIVLGKGPAARTMRINLPHFTLVGATTRLALLTGPLRDRFGSVLRLDFYSDAAMEEIVTRSADVLGVPISQEGARALAVRARGTPRVANRLLRRARDFAEVRGEGAITDDIASEALAMLDIDELGLDDIDRRILVAIVEKFGGGPVGIDTLAAAISEETDTVMDVYEPYLIKLGFLQRTPRGRMATEGAYAHLGLEPPMPAAQQWALFGVDQE